MESSLSVDNRCRLGRLLDSLYMSKNQYNYRPEARLLIDTFEVSEERLAMLEGEVEVLNKKLAFLRKFDRDVFDLDRLSDTDVTIIVDSQKVMKAHRFMLASKSDVFKRMFDADMAERRCGEVHIQGISGPVIRSLVEFLYTAEVKFTHDVSPAELFMAAHKYNVTELQEMCEGPLCAAVTRENCSALLDFGRLYSSKRLVEACQQFSSSQ